MGLLSRVIIGSARVSEMRFDRPGDTFPPVSPRAPASAYACNHKPALPMDQSHIPKDEDEISKYLTTSNDSTSDDATNNK